MDPVSMIVMALAAGAAAALKPVAETAIKDAYEGIKTIIKNKYNDVNVELLENDPASKSRQAVIQEDLKKTNAGQDEQLLRQVKVLLEAIQTRAPETPAVVGIDLEDIKSAALTIEGIVAEGSTAAAVKVKKADVAGNIDIRNVKVRSSEYPPKL